MVTSHPAILGLAIGSIRGKDHQLARGRLHRPGEDDHIEPATLGYAGDNILGKIADLRELGFADPVKMIHVKTADPGLHDREHSRQDRQPARARLC